MITDSSPADLTRFIRLPDVLARVPVSRPTIYRLIEKDQFPKPIRVGASSLWLEEEITDWVNKKVASR